MDEGLRVVQLAQRLSYHRQMGWSGGVGRRRRLAMFGGQGAPGGQLKELRTVVAGSAVVRRFVSAVAQELEIEAAAVRARLSEQATRDSVKATALFEHGFDVLRWAQGSKEDGVPLSYLNSVAVSMPLTLVIQLATYLYCWEACDDGFAEGNRGQLFVHGATGHSQGLAAAMVAGLGCTLDIFQKEAIRFAKVLLHLGVHVSTAVLAAPLSAPGDSWMLAVLKLPRAELERAVAVHNSELAECEATACDGASDTAHTVATASDGCSGQRPVARAGGQLDIAVYNGPTAHVVAGHPGALVRPSSQSNLLRQVENEPDDRHACADVTGAAVEDAVSRSSSSSRAAAADTGAVS